MPGGRPPGRLVVDAPPAGFEARDMEGEVAGLDAIAGGNSSERFRFPFVSFADCIVGIKVFKYEGSGLIQSYDNCTN